MQEKMVFAGQLDCYNQSSEILMTYLNVEVNAMQVHRVTDTYGSLLEAEVEMTEGAESPPPLEVSKGECLYAMVDGSMLLTREDGWNEVKLGRMFKESDCMEQSEERGWIRHSTYEAYLGNSKAFTRRFEKKVDHYHYLNERLIFITDGALWIKNWIEDAYPKATMILDYYHACEHLCAFAKDYFKGDEERNEWITTQKKLLLDGEVEQVIAAIKLLSPRNKNTKKAKKELLQYYLTNRERMDYGRYRNMGAGIVGSGAIESAHRTVIQKRMKQTGQRWTKKRAQNMLTLRCAKLNGQWHKVVSLICSQYAAAA